MRMPITTDKGRRETAAVRYAVAASMFVAAAVHGTVIREHYELWPLAGLFFLGLEVGEALLALLVVQHWDRVVATAALLANAITVATWSVSRWIGIPFGPEDFQHPEAVGAADLLCTGLELACVALLLPWVTSARMWSEATRSSSPDARERSRR